MKIINKILSIVCFLLFINEAYNQSAQQMSNWIAPTPNAYSFAKYGQIPVSNYSGVPNISIPLGKIKENDVETDISISYHGSGIKVDEIASWVGLGWNLNAGGLITRTVKDKAEYPDINGTIKPVRYNIGFPNPTNSDGRFDNLLFLQDAQSPNFDIEPDIFYFNFGGRSGKFVFDETGKAKLFNHQEINIKFEPDFPGNVTKKNESKFIITIEDGTQYEFDKRDVIFYNFENVPSAWYLTKITSPTGHKITFEYEAHFSHPMNHRKTYEILGNTFLDYNYNVPDPYCTPGFSYDYDRNEVYLSKIKTENSGWIEFKQDKTTANKRKDDYYENYPLSEIIYYDNKNIPFKRIKLTTSYFTAPAFTGNQFPGIADYTPYQHLRYRLRLDALQIFSGDLLVYEPPYTFNYYNDLNPFLYNLPYRLSFSQDHWGYYNNMSNNTLIPKIDWIVYASYWLNRIFNLTGSLDDLYSKQLLTNGANREPDNESVKACMLRKISYPTGGYTLFEFESNDYDNNQIGGGLRIHKITNYNESGIASSKEYIYKKFDVSSKQISTLTSGCLVDHPKNYYVTIGKIECHSNGYFSPEGDLYAELGNPSSVYCYYNASYGSYNIMYKISAIPALSIGYDIGYNTVIVREQGNGYTVYNYTASDYYPNYSDPGEIFEPEANILQPFLVQGSTIMSDGGFSGGYSLLVRQTVKCTEWPYLPPMENDWKRGLLEMESYYDANNNIVSKVTNEYNINVLNYISGYKVYSLRNQPAVEYIHGKYLIPVGWTSIKKETREQFDKNGNSIASIKEFFYTGNGHKLPTQLKTNKSDGHTLVKNIYYAMDNPVETNTPSDVFNEMVNKHIYTAVKEEEKLDGSQIIKGSITNYKIENNLILPSDIRIAQTDGNYITKNKYIKYNYGNLLEYNLMCDDNNINITTSFVWDYNNTLPVVKAVNIDNVTLTVSVTNALSGTGFSSLETLISSITTFPNTSWNTFNTNLRNIVGNNVPINTYTYKPLIGVNSITDENGITTYYEYDTFGRLKLIKRDDGKVLKAYDYHYKQ